MNDIKDLILKIVGQALNISNDNSKTALIFVNYSAHTNNFDIRVYANGWERIVNVEPTESYSIYLDMSGAYEKLLRVNQILQNL